MEEFENIVNITPLLQGMMDIHSISMFNIFLGIWVIWMARKLFNSIILSMNKIFRSVSKRKSWFNQLLTFISEFVMTLIIIAIVIAAFAFSRIISLPFFQTVFARFPILFAQSSHNLGLLVIYFILFISTAVAYRVIPGTKPLVKRCIFYAALNSVSFFVVSFFINKFLNYTNYNTIYGTISSLVLLMMKVYIFFILFLFFAQMIYVSQFFEILLRSEIYQLPPSESKGLENTLRRFLFINPSQIQTRENTVFLKPGDMLFNASQKVDFVYYIKTGTLQIISDDEDSDSGNSAAANFSTAAEICSAQEKSSIHAESSSAQIDSTPNATSAAANFSTAAESSSTQIDSTTNASSTAAESSDKENSASPARRRSSEMKHGTFLGDVQCILNEPYGFSAKATSSCELIKFSSEEFLQIIRKSHHAALKAISKLSYGRMV